LTSICKNISRKILRKSLTPVIPALGRLRQEGCEFHPHKLVRVAAFGKGNWVGQSFVGSLHTVFEVILSLNVKFKPILLLQVSASDVLRWHHTWLLSAG
jgi:hypothetical protein